MTNRRGKSGSSDIFYFLGLQNRSRWWLQPWNGKTLASWMKSYDKAYSKAEIAFLQRFIYSQSYGFSSSHVQIWELDYTEDRELKNRCFWIVVLEKIFEHHLDHKEMKSVNPKGNQPWIFIERTEAEAEAPVLWPPEAKSWLKGAWCSSTMMLGKTEGKRRWGWQRMRWLDDVTDSVDMVWANSENWW